MIVVGFTTYPVLEFLLKYANTMQSLLLVIIVDNYHTLFYETVIIKKSRSLRKTAGIFLTLLHMKFK